MDPDMALRFLVFLVEIVEPKIFSCLQISHSSFASFSHHIVDDNKIRGVQVEQTVKILTNPIQVVRLGYHGDTSIDHETKNQLGRGSSVLLCHFEDLHKVS